MNKKSILLVVLGIVLGVFLFIGSVLLFVLLDERSEVEKQQATQDKIISLTNGGDCPNKQSDSFEGKWSGRTYYKDSNVTQSWVTTRSSDGTYHIDFSITNSDGEVDNYIEEGLWAYSKCLYTTVVKTYKGKSVYAQEVYRVDSLDDNRISYSSLRTAQNFEQHRLND